MCVLRSCVENVQSGFLSSLLIQLVYVVIELDIRTKSLQTFKNKSFKYDKNIVCIVYLNLNFQSFALDSYTISNYYQWIINICMYTRNCHKNGHFKVEKKIHVFFDLCNPDYF